MQSTILLLPRLLKPTSGPEPIIATANSALLRYLNMGSWAALSKLVPLSAPIASAAPAIFDSES